MRSRVTVATSIVTAAVLVASTIGVTKASSDRRVGAFADTSGRLW